MEAAPLTELIGKTLTNVQVERADEDDCVCPGLPESIRFTADDGSVYWMFYRLGPYENAVIEDICGDLKDLIGSPIVQAEESQNDKRPEGLLPMECRQCEKARTVWTFYRFATAKGLVVIRWYGDGADGTYAEAVDFVRVGAKDGR